MIDHVDTESKPELIVAPPADWKRWAVLAVVFVVAVLIIPSQTTAQVFVHGNSISSDTATNRSEISIYYTNTGWNRIEVQDVRMMVGDREVVVEQPDTPSIGRNGTGTLVVSIPTGDCETVNAAIQTFTARVRVRPLGLTRRIALDFDGFEALCESA